MIPMEIALEEARASLALYADFARELHEATGIDIEYRTEGTLHLAWDDQGCERRPSAGNGT